MLGDLKIRKSIRIKPKHKLSEAESTVPSTPLLIFQ
jgi:hypothetical protein